MDYPKVHIELSRDFPSGAYSVDFRYTRGMGTGSLIELNGFLRRRGYREFGHAQNTTLFFMDAMYGLNGNMIEVTEYNTGVVPEVA